MITINGTEFIQKEYPVGEQILEFSEENLNAILRSKDVVIKWHYKDDKDFMTLWFIVQKIKSMKHGMPGIPPYYKNLKELHIPYFPYARMDRVKTPNQFFSLQYAADFINSLGFEKVIVSDAHSDVLLNVVNNIENKNKIDSLIHDSFDAAEIPAGKTLKDYVICFPDKTAVKRYGHLANEFYGAISIEKIRDFDTGKLLSFDLKVLSDVNDFDYKEVVIVDDICSYGGTFIGAMDEIKKRWFIPGFHLIVSHLEKSFFSGKLKDREDLKSVTTSNSFDYNYKGETNE